MQVDHLTQLKIWHKWNMDFKFITASIHRGTRFVSVFQYVMDPDQEKMEMLC